MPKRTRQHEIDELAQRALANSLPPAWVANPFIKDYGKDFFVEVVEDTQLTKEIFVVQLKGKEKPRVRRADNTLTVRIEREHLRYYLDVVPLPVFIVLADVSTGTAYFQFAQGSIDADPTLKSDLEKEGRATFRVPIANTLSDTALLRRELAAAWTFMREKYPGSVQAAVKYRERALTELDPRFTYQITIVDGKEHIQLNAFKEPVSVQLSVTGDPAVVKARWKKFLAEGAPLQADAHMKLDLTGSPIFEKASPTTISFSAHIPAEVRLFVDSTGRDRVFFPEFRGALSGGSEILRFTGALPGCPLEIELELRRAGTATVHLSWKPSVWFGQKIERLPWIDVVHPFLARFALPGSQLGVAITSQGAQFGETNAVPKASLTPLSDFADYVELLVRVRRIGKALGLSIVVPTDWTEEDLEDVEELGVLVTTGRYVQPSTLDFTCELDRVSEQLARALQTDRNGTFRLESPEQRYRFLGLSFDFSDAFHVLSAWRKAEWTDVVVSGEPRVKLTLFGCTKTVVWPRFAGATQS